MALLSVGASKANFEPLDVRTYAYCHALVYSSADRVEILKFLNLMHYTTEQYTTK